DYSGCTSLTVATRKGHTAVVETLLAHGANPNLQDLDHIPPLWQAARYGHVSIVRLLLERGRLSNVNPRPAYLHQHFPETPLSIAIKEGHQEMVELLVPLLNKCDFKDAESGDGNHSDSTTENTIEPISKLLVLAISAGCSTIVRELLTKHDIDINAAHGYYAGKELDWFNHTPLMAASSRGDLNTVRSLLDMDEIRPEVSSGRGTALTAAAEGGFVDVVKTLIADGRIQIDSKNMYERTALSHAAESASETIVAELLATGTADPNSQDRHGRTPLIWAVNPDRKYGRGNWHVARVLLSTADINVDFKVNDKTALMLAASRGKGGMVKLLIASGCNLNMQDDQGKTALSLATDFCLVSDMEVIQALLEAPGIQPDLPNNAGRTALSLAAEAAKVEFVNTLLASNDVNPDARDLHGRSPLSWVFDEKGLLSSYRKEERKTVLQQLLRISAVDTNAEDHNGLTPLLLAIASEHGNEYVEILLSRSDINVNQPLPGTDSRPLDTAIQTGNMDNVMLLRKRGAIDSGSDELHLDHVTPWSGGLEYALRKNLLRQNSLPLREQQAYVREWVENTASLCSSCSAIDLGSAFWKRHTEYGGRVITDLGRVDDTWQERACALCRMFATIYIRTGIKGGYKLVSFSTTQSWLCHAEMARWNTFRFKQFIDTMVLAVIPDKVAADGVDAVKAAFSFGLIGRLGSNGPSGASVTIPRLGAMISDWSVARGWITTCRENHGRRCKPHGTANIPHFYLIECSTRKISEHKPSQPNCRPEYVALSYVWGKSPVGQQPPQHSWQQESLDDQGTGLVGAAIEDAIRVTLQLGYQYLWVDRYCIVQTGDEAIKQEQLRHMHMVYANAEVTLIAAAGEGASAGLPGAPGRPRQQQPGAFIQDHALVCIPPDPSHHIHFRSTWVTRGWTYQEGLLACRRLYFSEYEMSYECRHMICREAIRLPFGLERRISGSKPRFMEPFWMYEPYTMPGADASNTGLGLFDLLAVYTTRQLSLPSDTLNAMLGILNLLSQKREQPTYHICGVPILRLNNKRSGKNADNDVATTVGLGGFLDGLRWRLQEPAQRRHGFPSWSWTGWQGVVAGMNKDSQPIKQTSGFAIDISIIPGGQEDGVAVPWNSCYEQLRMTDDSNSVIRSGQQHILEITASAATVKFRLEEYEGRPNTLIGTICAGDKVWQGEFFLTRKDEDNNENKFLSPLLRESWTGIVLGNSQSQKYANIHDTTLLVVQEQEHEKRQTNAQDHIYCERIGLLTLLHCTLDDSLLEQRTWRLK
ncbi:ankyrin repeat protein, partial [Fusarium avenaceum]